MTGNPRFQFEALRGEHDRDTFSCGAEPLDRYFKQQASQDVRRHIAAVWILHDLDNSRVVGFYTLSATGIDPALLPDTVTRRFLRYELLPAALLGRLAVDVVYRGQGFGRRLLMDALGRAFEQRGQIAAMAVIVDAKDDSAVSFYEQYGFQPLLNQPYRLYIPMRTIAEFIGTLRPR